ncbi:CASP-like protein 4A4 isoform X2 [Salvia splendens]|uniref:CASP-like protein 4A4 isoform X2 n=1 Tax=Salvia splendens TaxID=180675 RepID=UPI001C263BE9|nr:CASP-like protein 4A4 isoform X2 [Salvia splendens]
MSGVIVSPVAGYLPAQPPLPTPSPFSFSVASTRWSSRPPVQTASLLLRFLALLFSFGSAFSLVALPSTNSKLKKYPGLLYCFTANILSVIYAAYQIFKNICDIAHRGICISDKASDYISFFFDQDMCLFQHLQLLCHQSNRWKFEVQFGMLRLPPCACLSLLL